MMVCFLVGIYATRTPLRLRARLPYNGNARTARLTYNARTVRTNARTGAAADNLVAEQLRQRPNPFEYSVLR